MHFLTKTSHFLPTPATKWTHKFKALNVANDPRVNSNTCTRNSLQINSCFSLSFTEKMYTNGIMAVCFCFRLRTSSSQNNFIFACQM